jgi:hypothetical protein
MCDILLTPFPPKFHGLFEWGPKKKYTEIVHKYDRRKSSIIGMSSKGVEISQVLDKVPRASINDVTPYRKISHPLSGI